MSPPVIVTEALGYTGTRRGMTLAQAAYVEQRLWRPGVERAHSGDCLGGDARFHALAVQRGGIWTEGHPPDNPKHRAFCTYDCEWAPLPYLARNRVIVDQSTRMVATPGEFTEQRRSGTWATIRYATGRRPLTIVFPDGTTTHVPAEKIATLVEPEGPPMAGDGRCADCRKGHYDLGNGTVANFPCTTEGCTCWFCGAVVTPSQQRAHDAVAAGERAPDPGTAGEQP